MTTKKSDAKVIELKKRMKNTDHQIKETDCEDVEIDSETEKPYAWSQRLEYDPWEKFLESLVKGDLARLLSERDIAITSILSRAKHYNRLDYSVEVEYDIIATNKTEIVVVQVVTKPEYLYMDEFIGKLKEVRGFFSGYYHDKIYGAIAYLEVDKETENKTEEQGLFVIKATDSGASITNKKTFEPKSFGCILT